MKNMITYRQAQNNDINLIQELAHKIWFSHYPGIISNEQIDYMLKQMYSTAVIKKELEIGYFWDIIELDKTPIGFIAYCKEFDNNIEKLKLNKLYTLPEYHGKGIGQKSLEHVKNKAIKLGLQKVYLTVNKLNDKAIKAYNKFGFEIEQEVVTQIGNGYVMDDYIMSIQIKKSRN
jgi:ribosomal protein S18 acetylase RimI-like enzyme